MSGREGPRSVLRALRSLRLIDGISGTSSFVQGWASFELGLDLLLFGFFRLGNKVSRVCFSFSFFTGRKLKIGPIDYA